MGNRKRDRIQPAALLLAASSPACTSVRLRRHDPPAGRRFASGLEMLVSPAAYTKGMACAICQARRPRRHCPGVHGDICTICCGTEREVTVSCPLDCEYLRDARKHEKATPFDAENLPDRDIRVSEELLESNGELLEFLSHTLVTAAFETPGVVDSDLRDALAALIRTYRTLQTGIYYQSLPENALAAKIFRAVEDAVAEFRRQETDRLGMSRTRDADLLGLLVFLERLQLDRNNGRPRGRAFLDLLRGLQPESTDGASDSSPLVLP